MIYKIGLLTPTIKNKMAKTIPTKPTIQRSFGCFLVIFV